MVKRFLILTVALVLQYASVIHAAEPDSATRATDAILAKLKIDLESVQNRACIPGMSVAVIHKGKLIFAEGYGKRNQKDPFTPETRSILGSVTKAFTATAIGELVAEGKMDWDTTPVNTYLPEFKTHDPILTSQLTIQDLLSHRTNMPDVDDVWFWGNETRLELIKRMRHAEVKPKMPAVVNYNNAMYAVAGEAAARVAGVPFEKLVRDKIFRPLGLSQTGFSMAEMSENSNFAVPFSADSYEDAKAGRFTELPLDNAIQKVAAAGDIFSSALDLARWGHAIMKGGVLNGKQVLSKEGIEATLSAHTIYSPAERDPDFALSAQYGMGWVLNSYKGHNLYEHGGRSVGYTTNLALFPNDELVVAILTNAPCTALPRVTSLHIADELLRLPKSHDWLNVNATADTELCFALEEEMNKGTFPERVANKPPAHDPIDYAGEYDNPGFGTATVRLEGGKLHITFGAFLGSLTPYHFDSFTTVFQHPGVRIGQLVTFSTGPDGKVCGATFAVMSDEARYFEKKQAKPEPVVAQYYPSSHKQTVMKG
ncbi:hypothetical protein BG006_011292 [Podila minutissima]|uniref:Beta-lactamase n=1 Tax=Podila minutissima TaxID=64525 RepID=A0A9P5SU30_9FUNG|nr:hypothetical protein BG006_011292 [Podila minutissima]